MDETPSTENPSKKDFNKLDLSQLQGFSFGTQWSQEKPEPRGRSEGREDAPRRGPDRRDRDAGGAPGGGPAHRDRRGFRKPGAGGFGGGEAGGPLSGESRGPREGGRSQPQGEFRGGPRRDGGHHGGHHGGNRGDYRGGPGGERSVRFGGREGGHGGQRFEDRGPYVSPYFTVTFYAEDASFTALSKTIRASCRTFELFDIAKTVLGKPERFVVVVARKSPEGEAGSGKGEASKPVAKLAPIALSVPDSLPFDSEDAAIAHVLDKHLGLFFDVAEVDVDPPKGNFQIVNRCGVTGELLGPPNYHRYSQILQQHHTARIKAMSFDAFKSRVESVRDPEVVNQWLDKMKKTTRYTWKQGEAVPTEDGQVPPVIAFDSLEEARVYLLTQARDRVVRLVESVRFHGALLAGLPSGEIHRSVEGALERQRRFPLDTANALRGRLRREGFTIFKKGSKGVSYVCAVKRKFRIPGQTFSESIGALIAFIEAHPMVRAGDLPAKLLGLPAVAVAAPSAAPGSTPQAEGEAASGPASTLSADDHARLARMQGDLRWLVTEGYVTEFLDGRLFAPPAMVEARKKEIESADHDPENFPETPAPEPVPASVPAPAAVPAPAPEAPKAEESSPVAETAGEAAAPAEAAPVDAPSAVAAPAEAVSTEAAPAETTSVESKPDEAKPETPQPPV